MQPAPALSFPDKQRSSAPEPAVVFDLVFETRRIEQWLRFGTPSRSETLDPWRLRVGFTAGAVFARVRWRGGPFGTTFSHLDILRARPTPCPAFGHETAPSGDFGCSVSSITGRVDVLVRLSGWGRVQQALRLIDGIEAVGLDPTGIAPDYWHHVHANLSVGLKPRAYSLARHQAWLDRAALHEPVP
jgi:hypothetical protein